LLNSQIRRCRTVEKNRSEKKDKMQKRKKENEKKGNVLREARLPDKNTISQSHANIKHFA
jgi:hypothetical protein